MIKDAIFVLVTCSSAKEADKIADVLLDKRLVACVSVLSGVRSKFRWKGKIEKAEEFLMMAKTRRLRFAAIDKEVRKIHSYKVPEIVAIPVVYGSKAYLDWINDSVR